MNNTEETLDFEQKHKEDLQRLRGFRPMWSIYRQLKENRQILS